jgi:hypothetical protein
MHQPAPDYALLPMRRSDKQHAIHATHCHYTSKPLDASTQSDVSRKR